MNISKPCFGLFIDQFNNLYCSISEEHLVVKKSLNNNLNNVIIVAGNGSAGSLSSMLNNPRGIFMDLKLNLYVADCENNRIQLFKPNQSNNGTTVPIGLKLSCPTGIILDADNALFITDHNHHRIIASGENDFRCIAGCSEINGSRANELFYPRGLSFDSYGNIYVADGYNHRIQKLILATNTCGILLID